MATQAGIAKSVAMLRKVLRNSPEFDMELMAIWMKLFEDWSDEHLEGAVLTVLRSGTSQGWFPTPGEIREAEHKARAAHKDEMESRAIHAWETVRAAIRRHGADSSFTLSDVGGDGAALWAMKHVGARRIGDMTPETQGFLAAEARRLYVSALTLGERETLLAGKWETENAARGFDTREPALVGRPELPRMTHGLWLMRWRND